MAVLIPECITNTIRFMESQAISSSFPPDALNTYINIINASTKYILSMGGRNYLKYKTITNEYHDGKGCEYLNLKHWPVISITSIYDDSNRTYGSDSLIDSTDYEINSANAGIIRLFDDLFNDGQSNVKVSYIAGWSEFTIYPGINTIEFNEGGANLTATITAGSYNASTLATEIATQLNSAGTNTYTVTYSEIGHLFTISADASFSILWNTGKKSTTELGKLLGYDTESDGSSSTTHISDESIIGLPEDMVLGCEEMVRWFYNAIKENRAGKFTESRGEQSFSFDYNNLPEMTQHLIRRLRAYRMW